MKKRTAGEAGWRLSRYNLTAVVPGTDKTAVANLFRANCVVYGPEEMYLLSEAENLPEDHPILGQFRIHGLISEARAKTTVLKAGCEVRASSRSPFLHSPS